MNEDILQTIRYSSIPKWKIAEKIGYSDAHFSRILRKPLSTEIKGKILTAMLVLGTDLVERMMKMIDNNKSNLTLELLQKSINSIPKPPSITLSNFLPNDGSMYELGEKIYAMHPETAKKIIKIDPDAIMYVKNPELLYEEGDENVPISQPSQAAHQTRSPNTMGNSIQVE